MYGYDEGSSPVSTLVWWIQENFVTLSRPTIDVLDVPLSRVWHAFLNSGLWGFLNTFLLLQNKHSFETSFFCAMSKTQKSEQWTLISSGAMLAKALTFARRHFEDTYFWIRGPLLSCPGWEGTMLGWMRIKARIVGWVYQTLTRLRDTINWDSLRDNDLLCTCNKTQPSSSPVPSEMSLMEIRPVSAFKSWKCISLCY